jgi:DNA-binding FadR family transcriptional regulator
MSIENRADLAYARLRTLILRPEWSQGGRLPSETSLADEIGVSRPVVRQALARLRDEKMVVSRRGSGTFVLPGERAETAPPGMPAFQMESVADIEAALRFRLVIETASATQAAHNAAPQAIEDIVKAHELFARNTVRDGSLFDVDFQFHLSIARATRNPLFRMTFEWLRPQIEIGFELGRRIRNMPLTVNSRRVVREHGRILEAIQAGDDKAAGQAMHDHLLAGVNRLFNRGEEERETKPDIPPVSG